MLRRAAAPAILVLLFALVALLGARGLRDARAAARSPAAASPDAIVAAGTSFPIGTPVVLWHDPGGYDAYAPHRRGRPDLVLPSRPAPGCDTPDRLSRRSGVVTLEDLRATVTQFVLHYDQAYTSRNCFRVLHDVRGLSVHFLLDLDGTIYQTCDLIERCRHAREANDRSIGVEIAHPGALEDDPTIAARYRRDARGPYLEIPERLLPAGFRVEGFVPRPARPEPVRGAIHGRPRTQWDFTEEQYRALARLSAGLARLFPRIRLDVPRGPDGRVLDRAFGSPEESARFAGVLGHWHLTTDKTDPGPALDWERVLREARAIARRTR